MSDLTDRMRTCAAHIIASDAHARDDGTGLVLRDAADLLIEASNLLEQAHLPLGEPMEIIEPGPHMLGDIPPGPIGHEADATQHFSPLGAWVAPGDTLPTANPTRRRSVRTCPQCDSRANKTVRREGAKLMLVCPVCGATWEYTQ